MKKMISLFLALVLILSLTACGGATEGSTKASENAPVAANYPAKPITCIVPRIIVS